MNTRQHGGTVKCVVWDLDQTLWDGVLLEDDEVTLRAGALDVIHELDERGIVQSIASRNEPTSVYRQLDRLGIRDYFLYPQISWGSKVQSLRTISSCLNIALDSLAFIDDQEAELAEVGIALPEVLCIRAGNLNSMCAMPELTPALVSADGKQRRYLYQVDMSRKAAEEQFEGSSQEFLEFLQMRCTLYRASDADLDRAEELTRRTHQLNSTGYTYSRDELAELSSSNSHTLLMASLTDRFGAYGQVGLSLIAHSATDWTIKLLLMSCRVMSRGIGTAILAQILKRAAEAGAVTRAEFVPTASNRLMYVAYRFGGFHEVASNGNVHVLERKSTSSTAMPTYVELIDNIWPGPLV